MKSSSDMVAVYFTVFLRASPVVVVSKINESRSEATGGLLSQCDVVVVKVFGIQGCQMLTAELPLQSVSYRLACYPGCVSAVPPDFRLVARFQPSLLLDKYNKTPTITPLSPKFHACAIPFGTDLSTPYYFCHNTTT